MAAVKRVCLYLYSRCSEGLLPARQSPHGGVERGGGSAGLQQGAGPGPRHEEGRQEGFGCAQHAHGREKPGGQEQVQGHVLTRNDCRKSLEYQRSHGLEDYSC